MVKVFRITIILTAERCCHCMAAQFLLDINKALTPRKKYA